MGKLLWVFKALVILGLSVVIFGSAGYFAYQLFIVPNQVPPEEKGAGAFKPPPDPSLPELAKALELKKAHKLPEAQTALILFMEHYPYSTKLADARKALGEVNVSLFFAAGPGPNKVRYEVVRGDALVKIERKLKTTRELLMKCNNLEDPRRLSIGQVLYVPQPRFTVTIDRKARTVTLANQGRFFKEYHPVSWHAPAPKGNNAPPLSAKVRDKSAWHEGKRVFFGSKEYAESSRWVELSVRGFTFHTEGGEKPSGGLGFTPQDMEELSTLLNKNDPVSIL